MNVFEYEDIDLENKKDYYISAFKLFIRKPQLSFFPYLFIGFILAIFFTNLSIHFFTMVLYISFLLLIPILNMELSYANDYSQKIFSKISHIEEFKTNGFYKNKVILTMQILAVALIYYMISATIGELEHSESTSRDYFFSFAFFSFFILNYLLFVLIDQFFLFMLVLMPTFIKDIPQSDTLCAMSHLAMELNKYKFLKLITPIIIAQNFLFLLLSLYSVKLGVFVFFLGVVFSIKLSYMIAKQMSGGGSKLEDKENIKTKNNSFEKDELVA